MTCTRVLLLFGNIVTLLAVFSQETIDNSYWKKTAHEDLEESLSSELNTRIAKNVILFIGDGMGPNTVTATRIYKTGETGYLSWEKFPHVGVVKTYAADKQVPDSACTATAMFTGIKTNYHTVGVDSSVKLNDCEGSLRKEARLTTIAELAQKRRKATGIITTTRITHATPASMYAHSAQRAWECSSAIPAKYKGKCKDIAQQLIEDEPGKSFNVIMGGGRQGLNQNAVSYPDDPLDLLWYCNRTDGRQLINEWAEDKKTKNLKYAVVNNTKGLLNVDTSSTDYLMGIFSNSHMKYEYQRNTSDQGMPSLEQMTITAIKILMKNENGFLLMAEGGLIDQAHHRGKAKKAIHETVMFDQTINSTMELLKSAGIIDDTLVIVTADHSHTLTISGYQPRGNNILGIARKSLYDGVPYTTLGYANSGIDNYQYKVNGSSVVRDDPSKVDTTSFEYGVPAAVLNDENTHGGNDVTVHASGPFAHLFHRVHEQNYIATVIKYAARLGEYEDVDNGSSPTSYSPSTFILLTLIVISYLFQ